MPFPDAPVAPSRRPSLQQCCPRTSGKLEVLDLPVYPLPPESHPASPPMKVRQLSGLPGASMLHLPPGGEPQGSLCLLIQCLYLLESTAGADRVRLSSRDSDTEMETDVGGGVRRRGALRTGPRGQRGEPGCDGSREGLSPFRRPPRSGRWPSESSQVAARGWAFLPRSGWSSAEGCPSPGGGRELGREAAVPS